MQQSSIYVIEWQTKLASVMRASRGDAGPAVGLEPTSEGAFGDDFVEITGTLATYGNEGTVEITNRTDSSARVVWDEASFVDLGNAARAIAFSEKDKPRSSSRSSPARAASDSS